MDLYPQTARLIDSTENSLLLRLESAKGSSDFTNILNEINNNINLITSNLDSLNLKASKVALNRRQTERQKVEQLKFRVQTIKTSINSIERRHRQDIERSRDRENLLSRRYTANDNQVELEVNSQAREAIHSNKLGQAHNDIDNIIAQGQAVFENLKSDSMAFKRAKTKMLSIVNTLGLSNTLMRLIDKRGVQDKYLLYGMMIFSVVIMYSFWVYWKS